MVNACREPVPVAVRAERSGLDDLEREAARLLAEALREAATPRETGQRARHRSLLDGAIESASALLARLAVDRQSAGRADPDALQVAAAEARARCTLVKAYAAKARDALHGAGQLSLSAQRAPTREACDEGWTRVESIVAGAEESARAAALVSAELRDQAPLSKLGRAASAAAQSAADAASRARQLVSSRNHAYTFHADSSFSFGEGWYLAAAAVLAGVAIQIEPGKDGTEQAEQFLRDAGLSARLQPYRARPRAMKQTTEIVARVFRVDPAAAQRRLRAAFLGTGPLSSSVVDWVDRRLGPPARRAEKKVLLWIRDGVHHARRNTAYPELLELAARVQGAGFVPVLIGDALRDAPAPEGALDMILFWKDPTFRQRDMRRAQLHFFEHLRERHGLVGQLGVTTAGMDGPALMGLPTIYLTDAPNPRMGEWVGAVPGYREVVREPGSLDAVTRMLSEWRNADISSSPSGQRVIG